MPNAEIEKYVNKDNDDLKKKLLVFFLLIM